MEEFIASLTQFFTDWGYVGLFLSAFVAGSILPFSSEVVLVILVQIITMLGSYFTRKFDHRIR